MCYAGGFRNGVQHGFSIQYYLDETHGARFDRYICRGLGGMGEMRYRGSLIIQRQLRSGKIHFPIPDLQWEFAKLVCPEFQTDANDAEWLQMALKKRLLRVWSSKATCSAVDETAGNEIKLLGGGSLPEWQWMECGLWILGGMPQKKFIGGRTLYADKNGKLWRNEYAVWAPTFKTFEPTIAAPKKWCQRGCGCYCGDKCRYFG
jgi:hypothetical protein